MKNKRIIPRNYSPPKLSMAEKVKLVEYFFYEDMLRDNYDLILIFGTSSQTKQCAKLVDNVVSQVRFSKIAFVGGIPNYLDSKILEKSEASLIYEKTSQEIPKDKLILEELSTNTKENIEFLNNIYPLTKLKTILIVSNSLHLLRAYLTLKNYVSVDSVVDRISYEYVPSQNTMTKLNASNWMHDKLLSQKVAGELKRIKFYGLQKDLSLSSLDQEFLKILNYF